MVTLNTVSVTVYIKKKSIACLKVFTPSAMGRFKKPCNCYGPYSLDWPLEGSALPSLQHHNPPPPDPPLLLLDYISMRRIKIRIEALQALLNRLHGTLRKQRSRHLETSPLVRLLS